MPIVNPTPGNEQVTPKPNLVQIAKPEYKGVTVDTRYVPQSSLITSIQGSSWTVHYYSGVLGQDNDLSGQQLNRVPVYQQYRLIRRLEIKVQRDLSHTQNQDDKQSVITGSAMTYPFLIPQEGDMFLADIGDGKEGVFQVTNVERKTWHRESCFEIEYAMISYSTPERVGDLNRKTIEEYYFERDFLIHGQNPLILPQDYADIQVLARKYYSMLDIYVKMFFSNEYRTLIVPGQSRPTYDAWLMKAVHAFFTTWDSELLRGCKVLNVQDKENLHCFTIWDAVMRRDMELFPFINRKAGLIGVERFTENPMLEGIRYTGIKYVVWPADPEVCVNYEVRPCEPPTNGFKLCAPPSRPGQLSDLVGEDNVLKGFPFEGAPLVHAVTNEDTYIFSRAFYENTAGQSVIECLLRDYLEGKAVDRRALVLLTKHYQGWDGLTRFYLIPFILVLIRASIRSI